MTDPDNQSSKTDPQPIVTYVLAGYDKTGTLKDEIEELKKQKNVVVLSAKDYPSLDDAVAQIKGPANILLACHGEAELDENGSYEKGDYEVTGTFTWDDRGEEKEGPNYSELFSELKGKKIGTITVLSCFGGSSMEMLEDVPAGTVLQSMTGARVENNALYIANFVAETQTTSDPAILVLEALDNVDPNLSVHLNKNIDPNEVLPTMIGIGGNPPIEIDLEKLGSYASVKSHKDRVAYDNAVDLVKQHLDVDETQFALSYTAELGVPIGLHGEAFTNALTDGLRKKFPQDADKITPETAWDYFSDKCDNAYHKALLDFDHKIYHVAEKMKQGQGMAFDENGNPDFDEMRIRRALGIAYLKTSGKLDEMIERAKKSEPEAPQKETSSVSKPDVEKEHSISIATGQAAQPAAATDYSKTLAQYGLSAGDFQNFAVQNAPNHTKKSPSYTANIAPNQEPTHSV